MGMRILQIIILMVSIAPASAQFTSMELGLSKHFRILLPGQGLDAGGNGASLLARMNYDLNNHYDLKLGCEAGANGIANYLGSSIGVSRSFSTGSERLTLTCAVNTLQGLALFHPAPIYMLGISEENVLDYSLKKGIRIGLYLDLRYTAAPGYAKYSQVFSFFDLLTGLRFTFPVFQGNHRYAGCSAPGYHAWCHVRLPRSQRTH